MNIPLPPIQPEALLVKPDAGFIQKDLNKCYFCGAEFVKDRYDMYKEEVGEFWNKKVQDSVLAHADCHPDGIDAVVSGESEDWCMA